MEERSVAATTVEINLPAEALRQWRATKKNDNAPDALGNKRFKKFAARAVIRRMSADLVNGNGVRVCPDGSLEEAGEA